jgi:hypothetical protein
LIERLEVGMDAVLQVIDFFHKVDLKLVKFSDDICLFVLNNICHDIGIECVFDFLGRLRVLFMVFGKSLCVDKEFF